MDSSIVLAIRALGVAIDERLVQSLATAEAALQRERAAVAAQRVRLESLLRQARRHLRAGDALEAQELLEPEDLGGDTDMDEDDEEAEDGSRCNLCNVSSGRWVYYTLAPEGPWAGLEPSARIVCGSCHTEDLGRVDTAATLRAWTAG